MVIIPEKKVMLTLYPAVQAPLLVTTAAATGPTVVVVGAAYVAVEGYCE